MQYSEVANLWLNTLSNTVSGGLFTIKSDSKFTLPVGVFVALRENDLMVSYYYRKMQ